MSTTIDGIARAAQALAPRVAPSFYMAGKGIMQFPMQLKQTNKRQRTVSIIQDQVSRNPQPVTRNPQSDSPRHLPHRFFEYGKTGIDLIGGNAQ